MCPVPPCDLQSRHGHASVALGRCLMESLQCALIYIHAAHVLHVQSVLHGTAHGAGVSITCSFRYGNGAMFIRHMASVGYAIVIKEDNVWGGCCAEFLLLKVRRFKVGIGVQV